MAPNGNFSVADEYGPPVYEFNPTGAFLRTFTTPDNLFPTKADSQKRQGGKGLLSLLPPPYLLGESTVQ
ncbi:MULTISPECIES: esterase-like activity of phytase family protein [unclassified Anabaena]|uniref:esterase-like activity of phytase family protein n=1 Tax=unclassified Anabaena TaxID=2619674 RepID=UPI0039C70920